MDQELLEELYQSLVLDHSRHPRNFGSIVCSCHAKGKNPSCGDELELFIDNENNLIKDVKFTGQGCALSMSSASLMTQAIKGKTFKEAQALLQEFLAFILDEEELDEQYEPLHIFSGVRDFPLRVKCVLLSWRTLEHLLQKDHNEKIVSTE
jgi:nitrogen fixation protein NifU and related proteins